MNNKKHEIMKHCLFAIFAPLLTLTIYSCGEDNYDVYAEEELPYEATEVYVDDALSFGLRNSDEYVNTEGVAYEKNDFFHVGSRDVMVECDPELSYSFDGIGDFFSFTFFGNDTGNAAAFGGFTTIIDGESVTALDQIYPQSCPTNEPIRVTYEKIENRLQGTIKGEFYTFSDSIVLPFDSCVNYVSLGVLEASFDVELIVCD